MITVGLTGGIGSGKSTVSRTLASYGAVVVDADLIAREVVEPGTPGLAAVVEAFGSELAPGGVLDRDALGAVVFGDDGARARLSGILHPLIGARSAELMEQAAGSGAPVLVHDVPLLVENHLEQMYDEVVVVDVPVEVQLDRLVRLRGMTADDARARIAAQAPRELRLASATRVLDNSGTPEDLVRQVEELWRCLTS
ncbi:MAG: dephospho-CoA kinase [Frankiales bacterium]|nr:dephospho-CoA kinase [Frankiales bacterium]